MMKSLAALLENYSHLGYTKYWRKLVSASPYLSFVINIMIHIRDIASKSRENICKSAYALHYFN